MKPKAIFFDLDDTIIKYNEAADEAWRFVCSEYSARKSLDAVFLYECINELREWFWSDEERAKEGRKDLLAARKTIVKLAFDKYNIAAEEEAEKFAERYVASHEELIQIFPWSRGTLDYVKEKRYKTVLITNGSSDKQRGKIDKFNLEHYFDLILVEGEMGFGKPDTRVYQKALAEMCLKPHEVWMIGDNLLWDIEAAQKMGIFAVWNDFKGKGLETGSRYKPDLTIKRIDELMGIL